MTCLEIPFPAPAEGPCAIGTGHRPSTPSPRLNSHNGQLSGMRCYEFCKQSFRCCWLVEAEHVESRMSGTTEKRPQLDRLITDAHRLRLRCAGFGNLTGSLEA